MSIPSTRQDTSLTPTHGPRSDIDLGNVTEAAGINRWRLMANLVGSIESLFERWYQHVNLVVLDE
jgi:hypothetical protein